MTAIYLPRSVCLLCLSLPDLIMVWFWDGHQSSSIAAYWAASAASQVRGCLFWGSYIYQSHCAAAAGTVLHDMRMDLRAANDQRDTSEGSGQ